MNNKALYYLVLEQCAAIVRQRQYLLFYSIKARQTSHTFQTYMKKKIEAIMAVIEQEQKSIKQAGTLIATSTALTIFMIMHHPTVSADNTSAQVAEVINESSLNNAVHGSLIFMVILTLAAYSVYSRYRGFSKLSVVLGQLFFFISSMAMVAAAVINGFIYPDFIQGFSAATVAELNQIPAIKSVLWSANQTLANLGVITSSAAIVFWSVELLDKNTLNRIIGILGIIIGFYGVLAIALGFITLNLSGMTQVIILQSIWHFAMAYIMIKTMEVAVPSD